MKIFIYSDIIPPVAWNGSTRNSVPSHSAKIKMLGIPFRMK
jgi:hypothetical protein